MKRGTFLISTAAAAGAIISFPFVYKAWITDRYEDPLADPEVLLCILNDETCLYLGYKYLELNPAESSDKILRKKMHAADSRAVANSLGHSTVEKNIRQNIIREFAHSEMVLIDGWMLSHTEARQCALFYLNQQNS